jgi:hypothetical protein
MWAERLWERSRAAEAFKEMSWLILFGQLTPRYDTENRVFSWGVHVLKRFRQPANNQIAILETAEELGWPELFDDPLPHVTGTNPISRLGQVTAQD